MENRNGLAVEATVTHASETAEREAALDRVGRMDGHHRITLAADKADNTADFVAALRDINVMPHVGWMFTLTATAYNLVRFPSLLAMA